MEFYLTADTGSEITLSTPAAVEFVLDGVIAGPKGDTGATGLKGDTGATGAGVPTGGTANQYLIKIDGTNYNVQWATLAKASVGLGNVDNTSDANKPVSTAVQTALNAKQATLSITTTGTSGASTLVGSTLNIPQYSGGAWGGITGTLSAQTDLSTALGLKAQSLNPTAVKTGAYTAAANDFVPVDTTAGPVTITLPTAPANGTRFGAKHVIQGGTNLVTITRGGTDVFNKTGGSTSVTLTVANQAIQFQYFSGIWYGVAGDIGLTALDARYGAINAAAGGDLAGTYPNPTVAFANDTLHVLRAGDTMTGTLNGRTILPTTTGLYTVGDATHYYTSTYISRHNFNSTSYVDGGTASQLAFIVGTAGTNELRINGSTGLSIFHPTDNQLSISNNGDAGSGTGASLQLKPSSANYLFSLEGRGGFRYYSRVSAAQTFAVNDTGSITQVVNITASGTINTVNVIPTATGTGTVGDFTHYYSGAYLTSVNFNSTSGIQANGTSLLGTAADFWGSRGFKFGPNAGTGTDPLSGIIAGVSAYVNAPVFVIRGISGQTADLQRWQNSTPTTLAAIDSAGQLNLLGTSGVATHTLTLGSASTGIALHNVSDQTVNYERGRIYWASNILNITTENGGTGTARGINISTPGGSSYILNNSGSANGYIQIMPSKNMGVSGINAIVMTSGVTGVSSGQNSVVVINPTINANGTHGYTALLINPTQTAVGSGPNLLIDAQVGGTSKFKVDNAGNITPVGRLTPRTGTATSSATPTINTDTVDFYSLTAQAAAITSMTTNLTGTPVEGQKLWIAITGTAAQTIAWGASFENGPATLPTTTVTTQRLDVGFIWNTVTSKWRCVASGSA